MRQRTHGGQRVLMGGAPLEAAAGALIAIHGRGAGGHHRTCQGGRAAQRHDPRSASCREYLVPLPLSRTNGTERTVPLFRVTNRGGPDRASGEDGIPSERIALLGFSQGACLALEPRHAIRRYAGVIGFSGGLIGPPGTSFDFAGSLDSTPVFIGCSDVDPRISEGTGRGVAARWIGLERRLTLVSIREWVTPSTAMSWKPRGRCSTRRLRRDGGMSEFTLTL